MLRRIANLVGGRCKRQTEEANNLKELLEKLDDFDNSVKAHIKYKNVLSPEKGRTTDKSIEELKGFLKTKFREYINRCNKIEYEIFEGKGSEKHYINIDSFKIEHYHGKVWKPPLAPETIEWRFCELKYLEYHETGRRRGDDIEIEADVGIKGDLRASATIDFLIKY